MLLNISKKTKIVCTIGPASDTKEMILKLYQAGMSVMRVNFSHGTHEEQEAKIKIARDFEKEGIYIPCALDTKGPEIRTGYMENGAVPVKAGQAMRVAMSPCKGNAERFSVTYTSLYDDVKVGDHLLIDDGELDFEVTGKDEKAREILVVAKNDHVLKDQKGVNAPFSRLSMNEKYRDVFNSDSLFAHLIQNGQADGSIRKELDPHRTLFMILNTVTALNLRFATIGNKGLPKDNSLTVKDIEDEFLAMVDSYLTPRA